MRKKKSQVGILLQKNVKLNDVVPYDDSRPVDFVQPQKKASFFKNELQENNGGAKKD